MNKLFYYWVREICMYFFGIQCNQFLKFSRLPMITCSFCYSQEIGNVKIIWIRYLYYLYTFLYSTQCTLDKYLKAREATMKFSLANEFFDKGMYNIGTQLSYLCQQEHSQIKKRLLCARMTLVESTVLS